MVDALALKSGRTWGSNPQFAGLEMRKHTTLVSKTLHSQYCSVGWRLESGQGTQRSGEQGERKNLLLPASLLAGRAATRGGVVGAEHAARAVALDNLLGLRKPCGSRTYNGMHAQLTIV